MKTTGKLVVAGILMLCHLGVSQEKEEIAKAGTATLIVGKVMFTPPGAEAAQDLAVGAVLETGATISTGADSRAVILTSRQSAIRIGSNSTVVLDEMIAAKNDEEKAKVRVNLRKGSLGALIKSKEFGAMDFSVKTPHGVAAARGTFYAVAVTDEKSYTQVKEGIVEVTTEGDDQPDAEKDELGRAIPPKEEE